MPSRIDLKTLVEDMWMKAVQQAVESTIAEKIGSAIDSDVKAAIRTEAFKLVETNTEIREMLLEAIKSWISGQTADDVRKKRSENQRRFGGI
jgi:superfamily II helicase